MTRNLTADAVLDIASSHAEAPLWHAADRRLDWVEIGVGLLHRFDPVTGRDDAVAVGSPLGAFAARASGGFVLALEDGFAFLDADRRVTPVASVHHAAGSPARLNDGKCDAKGRFWAGSMAYDCSPGSGALYRLDPDLRVTKMLDGVTISNGLDWSTDGRTLFYIDTLAGSSFWDVWSGTVTPGVDAFDVAPETGQLSARRRLFDIPVETPEPPQMTLPDGMTIDSEGLLWIAVAGSGEVRRYSRRGDVDTVVHIPVACPTSVTFGGDDLDDLYITSMTPHGAPGPDPRRPEPMWPPRPLEGALFRCHVGVKGRTPYLFAG
ncbi:MAG: SMP-30/gluconolactonase/LRE family protein [Actinomycetota bacterium]|nr:SMP-30/gluconolactonase/LRE family protein [Actinomycetota bacterium]